MACPLWYFGYVLLKRDSNEELELRTTDKIGVSSAKGLAFEDNPSGKSFSLTKNNKGPRIENVEHQP